MTNGTVVFVARKVITMNPSRPFATHVAVRDGRIVATGTAEELCLGDAQLDTRFADKVLMPGFVEGHSHIMEGLMWLLPYVGAFDRRSPEGRLVVGVGTIGAIVARLKEAEAKLLDDGAPLFAWGFDPLHLGGKMLSRHDLDRV